MKGGNREKACSVFRLRQTGRLEELFESKIAGAQLPSGWALVLFNRSTINEWLLEDLSKFGDVVSCFVEDRVMFSAAMGWKHGGVLWSVIQLSAIAKRVSAIWRSRERVQRNW
jgi:hypothetical protein